MQKQETPKQNPQLSKSIEQLIGESKNESVPIDLGARVLINIKGEKAGVIGAIVKYVGRIHNKEGEYIGLELESPVGKK